MDKTIRDDLKRKLSDWFASERDEPLSNLGGDMLLDFIEEQMAWVWYNQGLADARIQLAKDVASLSERIELLEKLPPLPGRRR